MFQRFKEHCDRFLLLPQDVYSVRPIKFTAHSKSILNLDRVSQGIFDNYKL
jgi:hypothetical protein